VTIRTGQEWGEEVPRPADLTIIDDDARLHEFAETTGRQAGPVPPFSVRGGALARTLGVGAASWSSGRPIGSPVRRLPLDRGAVLLDGEQHWFLAHLVIRRSWWHGAVIAVMNAEHVGNWDVAPRAHPNDGRLDVVEADPALGLRQRLQARRRLVSGTHVPHPLIAERRVREARWSFDRPLSVWLDGVRVGHARKIEVSVEPDAVAVYLA
jgi:hypothetical protein